MGPASARYPCPPSWLFALTYAMHLLDEGLVAGGLPRWSTAHAFQFTFVHWLSVSSISLVLFSGATALVARRVWPSWVLVSLAVHVSLHALVHLGASVWWLSLSPGTLSGAALALPLAFFTLRWGLHALGRRTFVRAVAIGAVSFQAPWDLTVRLVLGLPIWTPG